MESSDMKGQLKRPSDGCDSLSKKHPMTVLWHSQEPQALRLS